LDRTPDARRLSNELRLQRELLGRDVTPLLGNFLEGHDFPRFLTLQPDVALFKNALTWLLLAEGIPIVYYGAAAGMAGGTEGNANRACLWQQPYDKESELFKLIATLSK
jgi:alpha-amylase